MNFEKLKLNRKYIFFLSFLIIIPLFIFFIINLTKPSTKPNNNIDKLYTQIEKCNINLRDSVDSKGLNLKEAENILSTEVINLSNIKDNLISLQLDNNKQEIKDKLLETLDYNINLYESCLNLIKKPDDNDILNKYQTCSDNYSSLLKNYKALNSLGANINFPEESQGFIDLTLNYFNNIIKLSRDKDIKVGLKRNYISNLEECIAAFDDISENLEPALKKIKEDNRDLNILLQDIKEKKAALNEIKNKSFCLSIPEEGTNCFHFLQDTITYYDLYITSLEQSIVLEQTCNKENNCKNIEENYNNSFSKYQDFLTSLKDLREELDKFNKK